MSGTQNNNTPLKTKDSRAGSPEIDIIDEIMKTDGDVDKKTTDIKLIEGNVN